MLAHLCTVMNIPQRISKFFGLGEKPTVAATLPPDMPAQTAEKRDFTLQSEEALRHFVYGYPSISGATVNNETLLSVPPMFAAIRYISEGIAMMNRKVKKTKKTGYVMDAVEHPIAKLMRTAPNPYSTWYSTIQALIANACMGNGYLWIRERDELTMRPVLLEHVPQHMVYAEYYYEELYYRVSGAINGVSVSERVPACDMIHIKGFSTNGVTGKHAIITHRATLSSAISSQTYTEAVYGNSARPSIAIKYDETLDENERNNVEENLMARMSGAARAGVPLVLDKGMDVQYLQWSPQEVAAIDFAKLTIEYVSMITKVPYDILSASGTGTYGSALQRNQNLLTHCYGPWVEQIQEEFNRKLFYKSEYESGKRYFMLDSEIFLRMDRKTESEMVINLVATAIMTPNEARFKIGLPPFPGGDDLMGNINSIPLGSVVEVAKAKYLSSAGEKIDGEKQGYGNQTEDNEQNTKPTNAKAT